jgi:hypothetical protein
MKIHIIWAALLLAACTASKPRNGKQQWVVSRVSGHSFQRQGSTRWYHLPADSSVQVGDTVYINYRKGAPRLIGEKLWQ